MMVPSNATFFDDPVLPAFTCFYNTEEERKTLMSEVARSSDKVLIAIINDRKFEAINVQSLVNTGCPDWLIQSQAQKFFNKDLKK